MRIYGPYLRKQDGRKHIVIVHANGRKQTKSYSKHLLEQKLGRELTEKEITDHIDGNFTNDDLSNLQVLTRADNIKKSMVYAESFNFICEICNTPSSKLMRDVLYNRNLGRAGPFCSRKCAGKYRTMIK